MSKYAWTLNNIKGQPIDVIVYTSLSELRRTVGGNDSTSYAATTTPDLLRKPITVHLHIDNGVHEVAHEAVHVACSLLKRGETKLWRRCAGNDFEELLAYPTGDITHWLWECLGEARAKAKKA